MNSLDQINFGERLVFEAMQVAERYCIVVAETTKHTIYLNIKFPERYPIKEAPIFSFMTGTTLDQVWKPPTKMMGCC